MKMVEQATLADRLKAGNEMAFRELFDEYYQALCLFAVKYLRNDAEAEDVVQESFIKYWNRYANFDHLLKIRSFLYTSVHNDCLNRLRGSKRTREWLSDKEDDTIFYNSLIEEEALRIFYQAVETLPSQTRKVICFALDGLNNERIAFEMGISENTVHMLKKLAYKKLKAILRNYYYLIFLLLK